MKLSIISLVFVACASGAPAPPTHVVHEKRETQLEKWSRRDLKLDRHAVIPISIGLTQQNLNKGYELLMDISHPESSNYGKHWRREMIIWPVKTTAYQFMFKSTSTSSLQLFTLMRRSSKRKSVETSKSEASLSSLSAKPSQIPKRLFRSHKSPSPWLTAIPTSLQTVFVLCTTLPMEHWPCKLFLSV